MRYIILCLIITIFALQYKLWFGANAILPWLNLEKKILIKKMENEKLWQRNQEITQHINNIKNDQQSFEEIARHELGLIKKNETYYQIIS